MNHLATAERLFNRAFSSEAARQELIQSFATKIEKDIKSRLLTNEAESEEIAGDMLGTMGAEDLAKILRFGLRDDPATMQKLLLDEAEQSIKRTAEIRAIKHVEAMTPESFLP